MDIHVLGPISLGSQELRVGLGSDKERCILASLALSVGRPIALDTLVDRLWDDPPGKARESIHSYVSRIRKAVRTAGNGAGVPAITHHAHTYTLETSPDHIDWHRFRRLAAQSRSLADSGKVERAVALLHQAEALWRGEALAGLPGLWPEQMRRSLAEQRLAVTLSRIEMELRLGRFGELVGELSALVAQYPDDERLLGNLMVACYGCGRHTDALRVHREARRRLREQFGTDPGEHLNLLHERILRRAPVHDLLHPPPEGRSAPAAKVPEPLPTTPPRNLPRHPSLVGRLPEMRWLQQAVTASSGVTPVVALEAISGMAGVGKTAVAVNVARELGERFPDGQLYINLRAHDRAQDPLDVGAALATLLRLLGVPASTIPSGDEERTALWHTVLARQQIVIVLDDAVDADQVRPLLPDASPSLIIVTSRRHLAGLPGARFLALDVLPATDAIALFRKFAGETRPQDEMEISQIVALCGYLPLAIEIAANRFNARPSWTLTTLRERLSRGPGRLGEFRDGYSEVARAFEMSYQTLTCTQRSVFRRLALHLGTEFGPHGAAALIDLPVAETEQVLEVLIHCHLIQEPAPNRYRFHDLLGEFARTLTFAEDSEAERTAALSRLIRFSLHAAGLASSLLYPRRMQLFDQLPSPDMELPQLRNATEAKEWFTIERSNLLAAERHARTYGAPGEAALLSHVLAGFLDAECHWNDSVRMHRHAADHWQQAGNRRAACLALLDLSTAYANTGRYPQALTAGQGALDLARSLRDSDSEGEALRALGVLHWHLGRNQEALGFHEESLRIHLRSGNPWHLARCQNNIAISLLFLSEHERALGHFLHAIDNFQLSGDQRNAAKCINNLGDLHLHMGKLDLARQSFEESLFIAKSIGSLSDQATVQANLAGILATSGTPSEITSALDIYQECLFTFRRLGDRRNEVNVLIGLGKVHADLDRPAEATEHHGRALELARSIGAAHEEAHALRCLGEAETSLHDLDAAAEHLDAAIAVARRIKAPEEEARAKDALARVRLHEGRTDAAASLWRQAFDIFILLDKVEARKIADRLEAEGLQALRGQRSEGQPGGS